MENKADNKVCVYAEWPSFYMLLALGKIPESHWLSIVIQVRALNWQPQKLPKQWAGQVEIDPSGLLNQIVSKSSVPCSMLIQSSVWPQCKVRQWKKENKKEKEKKEIVFCFRPVAPATRNQTVVKTNFVTHVWCQVSWYSFLLIWLLH